MDEPRPKIYTCRSSVFWLEPCRFYIGRGLAILETQVSRAPNLRFNRGSEHGNQFSANYRHLLFSTVINWRAIFCPIILIPRIPVFRSDKIFCLNPNYFCLNSNCWCCPTCRSSILVGAMQIVGRGSAILEPMLLAESQQVAFYAATYTVGAGVHVVPVFGFEPRRV